MNKYVSLILGLPKTIWFNFRHLPFKDAFRLPILLSNNTLTNVIRGGVKIDSPINSFMIRVGFHECEECNPCDKTIIKVMKNGTLIFKGSAHIGKGSKLTVKTNAILELGDNFAISSSTAITCYKHIRFGDDIQFGFDCLVIDSDSHFIYDEEGRCLNKNKEIIFDDKILICSRSIILKGTHIPSKCVIGCGSIVSGEDFEPCTIIAGLPAKSRKKISYFKI